VDEQQEEARLHDLHELRHAAQVPLIKTAFISKAAL
jgi:hypothetical protein